MVVPFVEGLDVSPHIHQNIVIVLVSIGGTTVVKIQISVGEPEHIIEYDLVVVSVYCTCDGVKRIIADQSTLKHTLA
jgi:hypothetical protein